jgi:hypothetical protein
MRETIASASPTSSDGKVRYGQPRHPLVSRTIAKMPVRIGAGRVGHAAIKAAKSASIALKSDTTAAPCAVPSSEPPFSSAISKHAI